LLQVHYAVAAVRAQLVNCNTGLAAPELLHVLMDSGAEVLVRLTPQGTVQRSSMSTEDSAESIAEAIEHPLTLCFDA